MSNIISGIASLLAVSYGHVLSILGQTQLPSLPGSITTNSIVSYLLSLNPLVLVIVGGIVFFAGKLAKFVGIVIVIIGVVEFAIPYLPKLL